ncbi:MAG: YaiO family outer membrane beta-barrel protein [Gammaproteobacteria bacterium]
MLTMHPQCMAESRPDTRRNAAAARRLFSLIPLALVLLSFQLPAAEDVLQKARSAIDEDDYGRAISMLEEQLETQPGDEQARYLLARALAWSKNWDAALSEYDRLLGLSPDNTDYLLGKAQVLVWSEHPAEALPTLERARSIAPQYEAVWRLESQALLASGSAEDLRRFEQLSAMARQRFPDSTWPLWQTGNPQVSAFVPISEYEIGGSYDSLDNGYDNWNSVYLEGSRSASPDKTYYAAVESTERFSERETEVLAGAYLPLNTDWSLMLEASVAPGADVLPQWTAMLGLHRAMEDGWGLRGGFRHAEYADSRYELLNLGVERYWGNWLAGYTLYVGWPEGADTSVSHLLRIDRFYGRSNRIGILAGAGKESESVGQDRLLTSNTRTLGVLGRHWLNRDWALSWSASWQRQGDVYNRGGVRVGLRRKF